MRTIALNALIAAVVSVATLATYDRLIVQPRRTLGVVDSLAVFRLEEQRLAGMMTSEMRPEQRERVAAQARSFAQKFPLALEQIAIDCRCLVVERSAIVGTPPHMVDLTPELRRRLSL